MTAPRLQDGIRLVATRSAISCSRLLVACTLYNWGAGFLVPDAVQVVDELATNAVKATGLMGELVCWTEVTHLEFISVHLLGYETTIATGWRRLSYKAGLLPDGERQGGVGRATRTPPAP